MKRTSSALALALLTAALAASPSGDAARAEKHFQTALKLMKRGRNADATLELQAASALDPGRSDVREYLISLGGKASPLPVGGGGPRTFAARGEEAREAAAGELSARLRGILDEAKAAYRESDEARAREAWRRVLLLEEKNAEALEGLARLDGEAYKKDADQPFDKLVGQQYVDALREARKGRHLEAKAKLEEALALNPEQAQVKALLAEVASGAREQAGERESASLVKDGERWLGEADYAKAAQAFGRALELKPGLEGALAGQAKVKAATGEQVAALLKKARAAAKAGKLDEAQRHYALALLLDPGNTEAGEGQAKASETLRRATLSAAQRRDADRLYNLGVEAWQAGDLALAASRFRETLKVAPEDAEAQKALAAVLSKLEKSSEQDKKAAEGLLAEGKRMEERGAPEEALKRYERALAKDKANESAAAAVKRLRQDLGAK